MDENLHFYGTEPQPPMKWHNFLIYFSLWAAAILNIGNGVAGLVRLSSVSTEALKQAPWLFAVLVAVCVVPIGLGALLIVTRFKLAAYKASGPKMLVALCAVLVVLGLIALVLGMIAEAVDLELIGELVWDSTYLVLNYIYYKKRAYLFVN